MRPNFRVIQIQTVTALHSGGPPFRRSAITGVPHSGGLPFRESYSEMCTGRAMRKPGWSETFASVRLNDVETYCRNGLHLCRGQFRSNFNLCDVDDPQSYRIW